MVDATALIEASTAIQTVVITVTLVVFVLQFRSQERAIKEASYQCLVARYNDLISTLVDKPDLALSLFTAAGMPGESVRNATKEDAAVYSHLLLAYGIIEEAFVLHNKKWISDADWLQWAAFLDRLSKHPMFAVIHEMTAGTFDRSFEDYVSAKLTGSLSGS